LRQRHLDLDALSNGLQIDIVLSDVMMPGGKSGLDLASEIRRSRANLAIILTTGYEEAAWARGVPAFPFF
jgi:YesN/AraC family two-component response regulator